MRLRLAALLTAAMSLVLIAFLVPLALLVRTVAADRAISAAATDARSIGVAVATSDRRSLQLAVDQARSLTGHQITVFLGGRPLVGDRVPATPGVRLAARGGSLVAEATGGVEVLVAVQGLEGGGTAVVREFVGRDELERGVHRAWLILAALGLALLVLAVLVGDRLTSGVVRPINELAEVSHEMAAGRLEVRPARRGPPEVRAVAAGLDHLAGRIQHLLRQERESVADLSHRLRTPLTALRLEVESLPDAAAVARLGQQVAALESAVTEVIEAARRRGSPRPAGCDAAEVVAQRCRFWSALAEDQSRPMRVELAPGPIPVGLAEAELAGCVDALLGNVFAHTPEGTPFEVTLTRRAGGGARLVVRDQGPGFGVADPLRRGASGAGSTGLGLDIARKAAESSGGRLQLSSVDGAVVVVDLGPTRGVS